MARVVIRHNGRTPVIDNNILYYPIGEEFYAKVSSQYVYQYDTLGQSWATSSAATGSVIYGFAKSPSGQIMIMDHQGTYSYTRTSDDNGFSWSSQVATQSAGAIIWSKIHNKFVGKTMNTRNPLGSANYGTYDIIEIPEWGAIYAVTYTYYGVGDARSELFKSTDGGLNWTVMGSAKGTSLAFNGSKLVATGYGFSIYNSTDGSTFTLTNHATSPTKSCWDPFRQCFWGILQGGTVLYKSTDGLTWTSSVTGLSSTVDVKCAASIVVCDNSGGNTLYYVSDDGINWSSSYTLATSNHYGDSIYFGTLYAYKT